jgi:hypothetical protein
MRRIRIGLVFVLILAAGCSTPHLVGSEGADGSLAADDPSKQVSVPGVHPDPSGPGVDLLPIHVPVFIFGQPTLHPKVQAGSSSLVKHLGKHARLKVVALPSPEGTVAVDFSEVSPPGHRWGEVMFPAERNLFRAFALDPSLGDYLVMLTDVQVLKSPDPIPLTAYRWSRGDVALYASCGIPDAEIDDCTTAFYMAADTRIVDVGSFFRGA